MRQFAKFIVALGVFMVLFLAVRAFAFAIYTVPTDVMPTLRKGDRVVVNKVAHATFERGDLMVFHQSARLVVQWSPFLATPSMLVETVTAFPIVVVGVALVTTANFISSTLVSNVFSSTCIRWKVKPKDSIICHGK